MKKLSSIVKTGLVGSILTIGINGCIPVPAPQTQTQEDVGTLSFNYTFQNKKARVNKKIAIVAPKFSDISATKTKGADFNALLVDYMGRLSKAMSSGFEELILAKGFTIGGKHTTFDDMTYPERKSTYMSLVPTIEITINKKVTSQDQHMSYYTEKGIMQVSGELIVKMIEPLSKQMFISKRIDLSDLDIKKEYTYENKLVSKKGSSSGGLIGSLLDSALSSATTPNKMSNNIDKVLTEALSEFYTKAMGKIDKYISQEEILALEKDVNSAKGKTGGSW